MPEQTRTITIASAEGLHARPAAAFAQVAKAAGIPVTVAKANGARVNAASILAVLALGAGRGDVVTLSADGEGADAVLDELQRILDPDHDAA